MVGSSRYRYPRDKRGACISVDGGGDGGGIIGGIERVYGGIELGIMKWLEEPDNIRRIFDREVINVVRNPIEMVTNAPLASALDKKLNPPILVTLYIHGGQVNKEGSIMLIFFGRKIPVFLFFFNYFLITMKKSRMCIQKNHIQTLKNKQ